MKPSQLSSALKHIASKIEASKQPKRELVIRDLKKILAAVDDEEGAHSMDEAVTHDQKEIEQAIYGRTKPFTYTQTDETADEDLAGSSLFWAAFEQLNMVDWIPMTDPEPVYQKVAELALPDSADSAVRDAKKNYEDYKKYYMDDQIAKLQELGLM